MKKSQRLTSLLLGACSLIMAPTWAMAQEFLIESYNTQSEKVLAKTKEINAVQVGNVIDFSKNCVLEVEKVSGRMVVLKADLCSDKSILKDDARISIPTDSPSSTGQPSSNKNLKTREEKPTRSSKNSPERQQKSQDLSESSGLNDIQISLEGGSYTIDLQLGSTDFLPSDLEHEYNLGIAYVHSPYNSLGTMVGVKYSVFADELASVRYFLNGTYSFGSSTFLFAGLNLHDFLSAEPYRTLNPAVGYQLGVSTNFTQHVGASVSLTSLRNEGPFFGVDSEVSVHGFEFGVFAAF